MFNDWFWNLLTIIAKHKRIKNCFRCTIQNKFSKMFVIKIREINRICSFIKLSKIQIFKTNRFTIVIIKRMLLQSFCFEYIFRNNITNTSILNRNLAENNEKNSQIRKNFEKMISICVSFVKLFTKFIACNSFYKKFKIELFKIFVVSLCIVKIVRFLKQSLFSCVLFVKCDEKTWFVKIRKFCVLLMISFEKWMRS